jgi:hypothetical protein
VVVLGLVLGATLPACGGESSRVRAEGSDDGTPDDGAADVIPLKNGIPIGDCRELSAAEQTELGCPAQPPVASSSCDAPGGTTCRYDISAENGHSQQTVFHCYNDSWGAGALDSCGHVCQLAGDNDISFDISDCRSRPVTECPYETPDIAPPTAQDQLNQAVKRSLETCGGNDFEIEFHSGCPTRLSSSMPLSPDIATCLSERLARVRWRCARSLLCTGYPVLEN